MLIDLQFMKAVNAVYATVRPWEKKKMKFWLSVSSQMKILYMSVEKASRQTPDRT